MMTMTSELLKRDGSVFDGAVSQNDKGKPGYFVQNKCYRCGGAGGFKGWPGFTCFRCAGNGKELPKFERLYTADELVKVNAAQSKRDAKKADKLAAKQAEAARVIAENTVKFDETHADLLVALGSLVETKDIVKDIVRKGREYGSITDAQKSVLVNAVASAAKLAQAQASSSHVGVVGSRIEKVKVTVTHVGSYERTAFRSFNGALETVHVVTMVDENGNNFVTKTPTFNEPKGDTFFLTGTVKEHGEYRGVKQTVLKNAKRTEIPTGQAAGFKRMVAE